MPMSIVGTLMGALHCRDAGRCAASGLANLRGRRWLLAGNFSATFLMMAASAKRVVDETGLGVARLVLLVRRREGERGSGFVISGWRRVVGTARAQLSNKAMCAKASSLLMLALAAVLGAALELGGGGAADWMILDLGEVVVGVEVQPKATPADLSTHSVAGGV